MRRVEIQLRYLHSSSYSLVSTIVSGNHITYYMLPSTAHVFFPRIHFIHQQVQVAQWILCNAQLLEAILLCLHVDITWCTVIWLSWCYCALWSLYLQITMNNLCSMMTVCLGLVSICLVATVISAPSDYANEYQTPDERELHGMLCCWLYDFLTTCLTILLAVFDENSEQMEKRGGTGLRPIPFACNGYDNRPVCLNGGLGPRKTWTKAGRFCVCLCPAKFKGPECKSPADSIQWKRWSSSNLGWWGTSPCDLAPILLMSV